MFLQTETYLKFGYEMAPMPEGAEGEAAIPHESGDGGRDERGAAPR